MAQGQDAAIDQAVRRFFSDALDWGQEFTDIFAPEAEVDVDDCIATLETRLALLTRRLAVKDFPSDIQSEASALLGAIPPDTLTSRFQALRRAQTGLLRAKIEADRLLLAKLHGDYAQTQIADPLFAGVMPSPDAFIPALVIPLPPTMRAPLRQSSSSSSSSSPWPRREPFRRRSSSSSSSLARTRGMACDTSSKRAATGRRVPSAGAFMALQAWTPTAAVRRSG
jgi:hypothetical protein